MSKTILIVDDSSSLRSVVRMCLTGAGYTVVEASDAKVALTYLESKTVDMIISDVNMPGMNGLEFCKTVKSNPNHRFTPVLMLTTEVSEDKKKLGKEAGAAGWMPKPFSPSSLLSAVQKLIK